MRERLAPHHAAVPAAFPQIATSVLQEVPRPAIDVVAMTDWAAGRRTLPKQVNFSSGFGEPPLVVYETPEFYLEVLFWFPSRTEIHGHGFTGAFQVLDGYSLQAEYEFIQDCAPEAGLRLGRLIPRTVELITPGKVCTIGGDEAFIHSVAHMGNPSLTLVARTFGSPEFTQFSYYRSGLAVRPHWHNRSILRQAEVFRALLRSRPALFHDRLMDFLGRCDRAGFFQVLNLLRTRLKLDTFIKEVLAPVRACCSAGHAQELAALDEETRSSALWAMLNATPDPRRRLLMALNEMLPDPAEHEAVISRSGGGAPASEVIEQWAAGTPAL